MRDSLMGIVSAVVLGGALALGLSAGQDVAQRQGETTTTATASSTPALPAATGYVITPEVVDCTEFTSPRRCRTTIFIRPGASAPVGGVRLRAVLARADGDDIAVDLSTECASGCSANTVHIVGEPATAVRVTFELPADWRAPWSPQVASGLLGIVSDKNRFDGVPKRLRVLAPSPSYWQWAVILVPGVLAIAVALLVVAELDKAHVQLDEPMGSPSWRASESWSSNLTVGAGLVNGVLALAVVSELTVFMTKPSYAVLSMLLGAFVLLAPIVYGISRRRVVVNDAGHPAMTARNILVPQASGAVEFEGSVTVFLIAGVLTLWASGGQLITFALLTVELWRFGALSGPLATIVALLSLAVFAGLLLHGKRSMLEAAALAARAGKKAEGGREAIGPARRAPRWNLL